MPTRPSARLILPLTKVGPRFRQFALVAAFALLGSIPLQAAETIREIIDIGSRRELFVDGYVVGELKEKAELQLHHPVPQEVYRSNNPWEGNMSTVGSTFKDGNLYRRYYNNGSVKVDPNSKSELTGDRLLCYEESDDGIHWRQPTIGLHEYLGSKANNILLIGGPIGALPEVGPMPTVFKDTNPNAAPDARYKAIFWSNKPKGMVPFKSPDGIHWSAMADAPVNIKKVGASMNVAFWDAERGEYRAYFRSHIPVDANASQAEEDKSIDPPKGFRRDIRTATSKDFVTWSLPTDLQYADSPAEALYMSTTMPYSRAPHIYLGFPGRYVERFWSDSMRALPDSAHREMRSKVDNRFGTAVTETLVMASHDGVNFKRWNEAFISPGIERTGTWAYSHQFVGWHPVVTKSALPGAPDEFSFYTPENLWISGGRTIRRYTLRLDGFVSARAPLSGGEVITKPLRFAGRSLALNFGTSAAGGVRVEIQDANGKALPGYSLDDCATLFGDTIERTVTWAKGGDVSSIAGKTVRLRFALKDADVYAFQFKP